MKFVDMEWDDPSDETITKSKIIHPLIFCDGCGTAAHRGCVGNHEDSPWWKCDLCQEGDHSSDAKAVTCLICLRNPAGDKTTPNQVVFKHIVEDGIDDWVHVACALWSEEVTFKDTLSMSPSIPSEGLTPFPPPKRTSVCQRCNASSGLLLKCGEGHCKKRFHPSW